MSEKNIIKLKKNRSPNSKEKKGSNIIWIFTKNNKMRNRWKKYCLSFKKVVTIDQEELSDLLKDLISLQSNVILLFKV